MRNKIQNENARCVCSHLAGLHRATEPWPCRGCECEGFITKQDAERVEAIFDEKDCLDGPQGCEGPVEHRMALSATGKSFPRCERHWQLRLDKQAEITRRYPPMQPADFDPAYAGESWDEP